MATTLSLQEMAAEIQRQQTLKVDLVSDTRRMSVNTEGARTTLTVDTADGGITDFTVNDFCHGQIATSLNIPKRYYDKMRQQAPALLDANLSHWFINEPQKRMVRALGTTARAFLSDRYRRLDNIDLIESLFPLFADIDGLTFHQAAITDERLYLRAVLPTLEREVKAGDIVHGGVEISNSEVGSGALTVKPFVLRLVCTNGMTMTQAIRKYHVGKRVEDENMLLYRDETVAADDKAFFLKVRDVVESTLTEARFDQIVSQLREATTGEKVRDVVESTKVLGQKFLLTDGEQKSVLAALIEGGDLTRWGMLNAVTEAAKLSESFDRQAAMEDMGGDIAQMSERDWNRVAVAA